jgi:hypothetical protein
VSRTQLARVGLPIAIACVVLSACAGGDDAETHALGETVSVGTVEYTESGDRGAETTLDLTPLAVRQGTQEELTEGGFDIDPEDQSKSVYYVDVRYENTGEGTVTRNLSVNLEDPDGNLINSTVIFDFGDEPFEQCEHTNEGDLAPGDSYESCTLFLVPEGVEIDKVSFLSDKGEGQESEFVYWETS